MWEGRDSERASEVQRQSPGLREGLGTGDTHRAPSGDGGVPERGTERERSQIGPSEPERDPGRKLELERHRSPGAGPPG